MCLQVHVWYTSIGLITNDDKTAYKEWPSSVVPGQQPFPQHQQDKGADRGLEETKHEHASIHINGAVVERVKSFKFLDVQITKN